jgi:hypothetical protein
MQLKRVCPFRTSNELKAGPEDAFSGGTDPLIDSRVGSRQTIATLNLRTVNLMIFYLYSTAPKEDFSPTQWLSYLKMHKRIKLRIFISLSTFN